MLVNLVFFVSVQIRFPDEESCSFLIVRIPFSKSIFVILPTVTVCFVPPPPSCARPRLDTITKATAAPTNFRNMETLLIRSEIHAPGRRVPEEKWAGTFSSHRGPSVEFCAANHEQRSLLHSWVASMGLLTRTSDLVTGGM